MAIIGGIASMLPMLAVGYEAFINNPQMALYNLFVAFLSGCLAAIEKSLRWQEPPVPTIDSFPDAHESPAPKELS